MRVMLSTGPDDPIDGKIVELEAVPQVGHVLVSADDRAFTVVTVFWFEALRFEDQTQALLMLKLHQNLTAAVKGGAIKRHKLRVVWDRDRRRRD